MECLFEYQSAKGNQFVRPTMLQTRMAFPIAKEWMSWWRYSKMWP
jgi:hypothetical protein